MEQNEAHGRAKISMNDPLSVAVLERKLEEGLSQTSTIVTNHINPNSDYNNNNIPWLPRISASGTGDGDTDSYLSIYPWLDTYRSSMATSTAGSMKSSRSRRSHKVSRRVKCTQIIFLTLLIAAGCFLIFYPLITHYIVDAVHANETHTYFPFAKQNCTLHRKHPPKPQRLQFNNSSNPPSTIPPLQLSTFNRNQ